MRDQVFISYSHADKIWLERLNVFLKPLGRDQNIVYWDDTAIKPTDRWCEEIQKGLSRAQIAILLISANFFASDFVHKVELPTLLKAAECRGARILPVIIGASRFDREPSINQFQAVNNSNMPLESLSKHEADGVLQNVANTIEDLFKNIDNSDRKLQNCTHSRRNLAVEITIDEDFDNYTEEKKQSLLRAT